MFGWAFGNYNNQEPQGGGGFFGHQGAGRGKFEQEYNCYPSSFLARDDIDKGNKIILPTSALEALARLNVSYPMLFEVCVLLVNFHVKF
jgi:ubiquitin fusion degradation protein 1